VADDRTDAGARRRRVVVSARRRHRRQYRGVLWIQAMVLQPIPGVADAGGVQTIEARAETGSLRAPPGAISRPRTGSIRARCPICSPTAWSRSTSASRGGPSGRTACSSPATTSRRWA
jgi:hypothetical protein